MDISADCLLSQIHSESLQELLLAVHHQRHPLRPLSIPIIDDYFSSATQPLELKYGDVLQVHGAMSSGKTQLLYFMLATCLMPQEYSSIRLDGWGKAAFVVDVNGKFCVRRLAGTLVHRLGGLAPTVPITPIVDCCLKQLHIFRPTSPTQLAATVAHLPKYHSSQSSSVALGILAVHSVDAFYWLDRFKAEHIQSSSLPNKSPFHRLSALLDRVRRALGPLVILTSCGFVQAYNINHKWPSEGGNVGYPWASFPHIHSIIQPENIFTKSPTLHSTHQISLAIATPVEGDTSREFIGIVQTVGRPDVAQFVFKITEGGVKLLPINL